MRPIILSAVRSLSIYFVTVVSVAAVAFYAARTKPSDMIQTQVQTQVQTQSQSMNIYTFTLATQSSMRRIRSSSIRMWFSSRMSGIRKKRMTKPLRI